MCNAVPAVFLRSRAWAAYDRVVRSSCLGVPSMRFAALISLAIVPALLPAAPAPKAGPPRVIAVSSHKDGLWGIYLVHPETGESKRHVWPAGALVSQMVAGRQVAGLHPHRKGEEGYAGRQRPGRREREGAARRLQRSLRVEAEVTEATSERGGNSAFSPNSKLERGTPQLM